MKITLIHGENQVEARARFSKIIRLIRERNWDVVTLNPNSSLRDQLVTDSLFSENVLFVKENNIDKMSSDDMTWLNKNFDAFETNLLLYHKGNLAKTIINKLPKDLKVENFDLPKELFVFLETIYLGNSKTVLKFFHKIIKTEALELVFTMLARHMKDLYWVSVDEKTTGYPFWKIAKLKSQAKKFSQKKLEQFITDLAEIDLKVKTSQGEMVQLLDFLFVKTLE